MFWVADYESELKIQKFERADPTWRTKMQKLLDWDEILYSRVFGVTDYESEIEIQKFAMVDPISDQNHHSDGMFLTSRTPAKKT